MVKGFRGLPELVLAVVMGTAACSSNASDGDSNKGPPIAPGCGADPSGAASAPPTSGSGLHDMLGACNVVATAEVTPQAARHLGFSVDRDLSILRRTHRASFHHGDFACAAGVQPSVDGEISIRATLLRIDHKVQGPASEEIDPSVCQDFLIYHCDVELSTDDGTISGRFEAPAYWDVDSLAMSVGYVGRPPACFAGTLGIRVDRTRARAGGVVSVGATLGAGTLKGQLFTLVAYADGADPMEHHGDGMFWPSDNVENHCGWLEVPDQQSEMVSLDEYNRL